MIEVDKLGQALGQVHGRWPNAQIGVNKLGNLVVWVDDEPMAWIDIGVVRPGSGEVNLFADEEEP